MNDAAEDRWSVLPGLKWSTPLEARSWLVAQRRLHGWSHRDVEKLFSACAFKSDLYIGPGGGELFPRATEKRVARFEQEGQSIPDWMYWMPLAFELAPLAHEERDEWERQNIPENRDLRRDQEEADRFARTFYLEDDEIALIDRFQQMNGNERTVILHMAEPKVIGWWVACLRRAADRQVDLVDVVDKALS